MSSAPFFSIIVTMYNQSAFAEGCMASLLRQINSDGTPFADFECIVIDDGSMDDIGDVMEKYTRENACIKFVRTRHKGHSHARNIGISAAKGKYISFLDGDDTLSENCLSTCKAFLDSHHGLDMLIFGFRDMFFENGKLVREEDRGVPGMVFDSVQRFAGLYIREHNMLLYSAGNKFYRKRVIDREIIRFREDLTFGEDRLFNYEFLRKCSKRDSKMASIPECLYEYRRSEGTLSTSFRRFHILELLKLHKAKIECFADILGEKFKEELREYEAYDHDKECRNALAHLYTHLKELDHGKVLPERQRLIKYGGDALLKGYVPSASMKDFIDSINSDLFLTQEIAAEEFESVLVLGSYSCDYRVRKALEVFKDTKARFICSGGNPSKYTGEDGSPLMEAIYMKKVLVEGGVSEDRIALDTKATNTRENLRNCSRDIRKGKCCIITAGFHTKRVKMLLEKQGLEARILPAYGSSTAPDNWFLNPSGLEVIAVELYKSDPNMAATLAGRLIEELYTQK